MSEFGGHLPETSKTDATYCTPERVGMRARMEDITYLYPPTAYPHAARPPSAIRPVSHVTCCCHPPQAPPYRAVALVQRAGGSAHNRGLTRLRRCRRMAGGTSVLWSSARGRAARAQGPSIGCQAGW